MTGRRAAILAALLPSRASGYIGHRPTPLRGMLVATAFDMCLLVVLAAIGALVIPSRRRDQQPG
jgi:hypothetical protein